MDMETRYTKALEMANQGIKRDEIRRLLSIDYNVLKRWLDNAGVEKLTNKPVYNEDVDKAATRKEEAIRLAKLGLPRREIAFKLHANYGVVKRILDEAGIEPLPPTSIRQNNNGQTDFMWDTSDENLRRARIAKRASQGAREALKAMGAL